MVYPAPRGGIYHPRNPRCSNTPKGGKSLESLKKKKTEERQRIFLIIKALALFFCTYPLFELFFQYSSTDSVAAMNLQSLLTSFALLLVMLFVWLLLNASRSGSKVYTTLEIIVFYAICLISVMVSGGYTSAYKFLFVYMVVAYSIQIGPSVGMFISGLAAATLLVLDFISYKEPGVNKYMQSDLAMGILFFTIAYLLGRYTKMENRHIDELTTLANRDGLTGLYNHRYFYEKMEEAFDRERESQSGLALIMFDIDFFKQYNDIFGHQKGDVVLKQLAETVTGVLPENALFCRYGGEEFAVLLTDTNTEEAQQFAEKIRLAVRDMPVEGEDLITGGCLTVSLGLSAVQPEDEKFDDVIYRADSALYRAKYLRKDRVETYMDLLDQFRDINDEMREAVLSARALINVVNVRDSYTYQHTERVVFCCDILARGLNLSDKERETLILSAFMHDLGKVNVPKDVLIANRKLNDSEWEQIRRHPTASYEIIERIPGMKEVAKIAEQHHERYDGRGYPHGIAGEDIHPLARLLSLADSFDAMTNDRPYKRAKTFNNAFYEIMNCAGSQFDPELAKEFVRIMKNETEKSA